MGVCVCVCVCGGGGGGGGGGGVYNYARQLICPRRLQFQLRFIYSMWQQLVTLRKSWSGMQVPVKVHARAMVRCILVVHVSLAMNTTDGLDELVKPVRFSRQLEHIIVRMCWKDCEKTEFLPVPLIQQPVVYLTQTSLLCLGAPAVQWDFLPGSCG